MKFEDDINNSEDDTFTNFVKYDLDPGKSHNFEHVIFRRNEKTIQLRLWNVMKGERREKEKEKTDEEKKIDKKKRRRRQTKEESCDEALLSLKTITMNFLLSKR